MTILEDGVQCPFLEKNSSPAEKLEETINVPLIVPSGSFQRSCRLLPPIFSLLTLSSSIVPRRKYRNSCFPKCSFTLDISKCLNVAYIAKFTKSLAKHSVALVVTSSPQKKIIDDFYTKYNEKCIKSNTTTTSNMSLDGESDEELLAVPKDPQRRLQFFLAEACSRLRFTYQKSK